MQICPFVKASFEINHNELSHLSLYEFIDSGSRKDFDNIWKALNRKGKAKGELPVKLASFRSSKTI